MIERSCSRQSTIAWAVTSALTMAWIAPEVPDVAMS